MLDKLKNMFQEETAATCIVLGVGVIGGIVIAMFTPICKMFKRKRY